MIGATVGTPDAETALTVYNYKELSAYILILPGQALKITCDLTAFHALESREALIGLSNAIPLALELILGRFKPPPVAERRVA